MNNENVSQKTKKKKLKNKNKLKWKVDMENKKREQLRALFWYVERRRLRLLGGCCS